MLPVLLQAERPVLVALIVGGVSLVGVSLVSLVVLLVVLYIVRAARRRVAISGADARAAPTGAAVHAERRLDGD